MLDCGLPTHIKAMFDLVWFDPHFPCSTQITWYYDPGRLRHASSHDTYPAIQSNPIEISRGQVESSLSASCNQVHMQIGTLPEPVRSALKLNKTSRSSCADFHFLLRSYMMECRANIVCNSSSVSYNFWAKELQCTAVLNRPISIKNNRSAKYCLDCVKLFTFSRRE